MQDPATHLGQALVPQNLPQTLQLGGVSGYVMGGCSADRGKKSAVWTGTWIVTTM